MKHVVVILIVLLNIGVLAQSKKKKGAQEVKFGVQFKPVVPINYFGAGPQTVTDSIASLTVSPKLGYNLGMVVRTDFSDLLSFETGINYIRRNFDMDATGVVIDSSDHSDFGFVSYQIPLQALVYIRLSENIYMNTSGGLGIDWYASHVQSIGENGLLKHISLRRYWMHFSVLANIGFEWRTENAGGFYVGASFVNPVKPITDTRVDYYYDNTDRQRYEMNLRGTFITVDLRYFFP
ncbi:PorT family protein [Parvicella tangerina]|uniref:Outer membrane protein beta-barrel domain-containing protein n=1 Tax=Parvicella tangerina TaxID=2829795 RepID=A0A916JQE3_9FLAO|nr:PorT family protein [Parvicella tangerina]CAG5087571.1 hypothetical protein CRYO30217_03516 [Parvicella tangerina]